MSQDRPDSSAERLETLLRGLGKLPTRPGVSFRGWRSGEPMTRPGQTVATSLLTATSRDPRVATENFSSDGIAIVIGQTGRDVAPFSAQRHEAETVFLPSTLFRVGSTARIGDLPVVVIDELDVDRDPAAPQQPLAAVLAPAVAAVQAAQSRAAVAVTSPGKFVGPVE